MIQIAGGTFVMGSNEIQGYGPEHSVTLSDFYMSKYEVTQEQYEEVMGSNPSGGLKGAHLPVEQVSWYDAVEFCNAFSEKEGLETVYTINGTDVTQDITRNGYRLPTEAEWEYAARGGNGSPGDYTWSGSNTADEVAWTYENSEYRPHTVGTKRPNELGLYDMSGSVQEWCWDFYDSSYPTTPETDPEGPSSGNGRMFRGGSWHQPAESARSVIRTGYDPDNHNAELGIRLVRRQF